MKPNSIGDGSFPQNLGEFLDATHLMHVSVREGLSVWAAPVYFIRKRRYFYFISSVNARHTLTVPQYPEVAVTIARDALKWQDIQGLQMRGDVSMVVRAREKWVLSARFLRRFPQARDIVLSVGLQLPGFGGSTLQWYRFEPREMYWLWNQVHFGAPQRVEPDCLEQC